MKKTKPKVGILMTLSDIYRQNIPEMSVKFAKYWRGVLQDIISDCGDLFFTDVAHTANEFSLQVEACEDAGCDLITLLPMAYAPSGAAIEALDASRLPLVIISTARDAPLPYNMGGEHLLANQALHGGLDLTNILRRKDRDFYLVAGHHSQATFCKELQRCVQVAAGASILRYGRVGRIGDPFAGMLDFTYDPTNLSESLGFEVVAIGAQELGVFAKKVEDKRIKGYIKWARSRFDIDPDLTSDELAANAVWSQALEDMVDEMSLEAIAMNFQSVVQAGAEAMPFLGASRLMSKGVGYAGEGDVLCACLTAALAKIAGEATFTEFYSADYSRNEILLSHMGECNFELANPAHRVKLVARDFPWGKCKRLAIPVFQMRPGQVTLVSMSETPVLQATSKKSFQMLVVSGEIIDAPEQPNLKVPYSRIRFNCDIDSFVKRYSRAGGTHHLALSYGDLVGDMEILSNLCQIGLEEI